MRVKSQKPRDFDGISAKAANFGLKGPQMVGHFVTCPFVFIYIPGCTFIFNTARPNLFINISGKYCNLLVFNNISRNREGFKAFRLAQSPPQSHNCVESPQRQRIVDSG